METKEIRIYVREYGTIGEMEEKDRALLLLARQSATDAYAPYSGFKVGAAVRLENGEQVTGSNQENAAYPSGLCAERVALFYAGSKFPGIAVNAIAIAAVNKEGKVPSVVSPCGACRQVMQEAETRFQQKIRVILDGQPIIILEGIDSLLPFSFKQEYL